jgi:ABC-type transporter Mla MlaB component
MEAAPARPDCVTLAIRGPLQRADLPALFERTCALLQAIGPRVLRCEVAGMPADAVAVDALARLALAARRHDARIMLIGMSGELRELVVFAGLDDVLE